MAAPSRLYVGGLAEDMTERDIRDEFEPFGPLRSVWIARKPPGFAFVEYEDLRDAEDSVRKLDGHKGWRVEFSRAGPRSRGPPGGGYGGPPPYGGGGYGGGYGGPPPRGGGGGGRDLACYNCGVVGHIARDCRAINGDRGYDAHRGGGGGGGYSRRDSPPRRYRSRSRSPVRRRRSPSASPVRRRRSPSVSPPRRRDSRSASPVRRRDSRSASPVKRRDDSRSPDRARSVSRGRSRSRS